MPLQVGYNLRPFTFLTAINLKKIFVTSGTNTQYTIHRKNFWELIRKGKNNKVKTDLRKEWLFKIGEKMLNKQIKICS